MNSAFNQIRRDRDAREEAVHQAELNRVFEEQRRINEVTEWLDWYRVMVVGVLQDLRQQLYPGSHVVTNRPGAVTLLDQQRYNYEAVWEIGLVTKPFGVDTWDWRVRVVMLKDENGDPTGFLCDRWDSVTERTLLIFRLLRRIRRWLFPPDPAQEAAIVHPQYATLDRDDLIRALRALHPVPPLPRNH